ncbi:TspO/MBR family protein [Bradyrhizobium guangdongense]|uniref:Tryptophan-rich sensory protein n=1 Tax=Bradyrhizobium guangdongense TaxID=1325090 RepID=A0A410UZZ1_9BRAD|nr:TspO/MBR family protein [Bradyrhizobium guangdongense]QAU36978.1 tryptophan-rich sensory protein [Bradyrhizobium guangdongense]QOZ58031.1 tryptophan-rich sensory protein [Bradyrhizobium guangdongense]GGI31040.1 tryptophan-rich sensory protein [Bradyrhizobium guangdongense]
MSATAKPPMEQGRKSGNWYHRAAFLCLVPAAGLLIGVLNRPGAWYAALTKPPFNPPDAVFAPVWTILFLLIAVAGYRTFEAGPRGAAMKIWIVQMILNFAWSPIFFSLHRMDIALGVIIAMFVAIVAFVRRQWSADRLAALLFLPYAGWVAFAMLLNLSLLLLN